MAWAEDWAARIAGQACRWCEHGRPDEIEFGTRIYAGHVSDAYFARRAFVRGYVVVVWRGRHVVEPVDLTSTEADQYHREVLAVARAVRDHFRPMKLNYLTMGNWEPHLHTHVTARYYDDPGAGGPLPAVTPPLLDERQWRDDAAAVRKLLAA
ncbi:HIT family protein [Micromonospora chersina]|uniref:HIT family protein n=1 Tax=Micromonospora chersina TaxID=47854 RepID=UPI0033CA45DC